MTSQGPKPEQAKPTLRRRVSLTSSLRQNTADAWDAVIGINDPPALFQLANRPVWVSADGRFEAINSTGLCRIATDQIDFFRIEEDGEEAEVVPPERLFRNMLAGLNLPLPELRGITSVPVYSRNYKLHDTPGYSSDTKLYYAPPEGFELPDDPDPKRLEDAKGDLVKELLGDFPFDCDASKAHTVAAILLPFVRPMIDGPTPLHLIDKPKSGTGATLLAEIIALPGVGTIKSITFPTAEEERRRTLFCHLRDCPGALLLDNVTSLEGSTLASLLTQTTMEDRIVGESRSAAVPNLLLWLGSGNNPGLSDEIARRVIPIRIDAKMPRPETRSGFRYPNLKIWATEQRNCLVWACLTIIQTWITAGKPRGRRMLGGFESWSAVIGGILEVAGIPGFLDNLEDARSRSDVASEGIRSFVSGWAEQYGNSEVKTSDLLPLTGDLDLGSGDDRSRGIRLGRLLLIHTDQYFGRFAIRRGRVLRGYHLWLLTEDSH